MVRHEINRGSLKIAYGLDHMTGVFLSIYDKCLAWEKSASQEVNDLTSKIGTGDGSGNYFDLHTGVLGFGHKVSIATMKIFMERYDLPKMHIDEFCGNLSRIGGGSATSAGAGTATKSSKPSPATGKCIQCWKDAKMRCKNCQQAHNGLKAFLCSKKCQKENWASHKHFCALPPPNNKVTAGKRTFRGILLPVDAKKPVLVNVPWEKRLDEDERTEYIQLDLKPFVGDFKSQIYMNRNPRRGTDMPDTLKFYFRDNFLNDGSVPNECVRATTGGKMAHDWRGPILVVKTEGQNLDNTVYLDMELSDAIDIIDIFELYGQ